MRQAAKRDRNEKEIVSALEGVGCVVHRLSQAGIPDLLVSRNHVNYLIEVKEPRGSLTEDQKYFFETWRGQAAIVHTVEEAMEVVGL